MTDVQFDEQMDTSYTQNISRKAKQGFLMRLVFKLGLAKDEKGANIVFIAVSLLSVVAAIWIFLYYVEGYNPFAVKVTPMKGQVFYILPGGRFQGVYR